MTLGSAECRFENSPFGQLELVRCTNNPLLMSADEIAEVEREIDATFADNDLTKVPWTQSAWTLLSVAEDHHFEVTVVQPLPEREAAIYVDGLINALTHPLRVLLRRTPKAPASLDRRYIEAHYGLALEWLD